MNKERKSKTKYFPWVRMDGIYIEHYEFMVFLTMLHFSFPSWVAHFNNNERHIGKYKHI